MLEVLLIASAASSTPASHWPPDEADIASYTAEYWDITLKLDFGKVPADERPLLKLTAVRDVDCAKTYEALSLADCSYTLVAAGPSGQSYSARRRDVFGWSDKGNLETYIVFADGVRPGPPEQQLAIPLVVELSPAP